MIDIQENNPINSTGKYLLIISFNMSISAILQQWFSNSPAHGIRRIGQAKTLLARLFWSYTSWIFTILMCYFIHIVIMQYCAHPTKIQLTLRPYRYPEHFPAITFCKRKNTFERIRQHENRF